MIKVERLFKAAQNIVISQLPVADKDEVIIQAIDSGVIEIYKRFNLMLNIEEFKTNTITKVYELKNKDISQVIQIQNSEGKALIVQNTLDDTCFDYRPITYRKFLFNDPKDETCIAIYKAAPEQIETKEQVIDIPLDFFNVLLDYVAYRCHITLNNDNLNEVDTHYLRFEKSIQELEKQGYKQELSYTWKSLGDWKI